MSLCMTLQACRWVSPRNTSLDTWKKIKILIINRDDALSCNYLSNWLIIRLKNSFSTRLAFFSVADPNTNPGFGAFLIPGSGIPGKGKKNQDPDPGWRTQIILYFHEPRNHFFGLKYLSSFMRIRDGKNSDPGWKKISDQGTGINIPDPQHWFFYGRQRSFGNFLQYCLFSVNPRITVP